MDPGEGRESGVDPGEGREVEGSQVSQGPPTPECCGSTSTGRDPVGRWDVRSGGDSLSFRGR